MTVPVFLTSARLLLGEEELLAHVLMCLPIQDVEDGVSLGKQLHLIKRGLLWWTEPALVEPTRNSQPTGATGQHLLGQRVMHAIQTPGQIQGQ